MNAVVTFLIDGLTYASWLFIVAVGLTLVFGVLKILNIAHGSFYALGAYAAATFVGWAATMKWAPGFSLVAMLLAAVVVAPVVEELLFRGLLLQGLMLRFGFWPAALVSSLFFGVLHTGSLDAAGAALALATGTMGLGLCVLARRTGRLAPGIGVHALRNAVALSVVAFG